MLVTGKQKSLSVSFRIDEGIIEHNNREFTPHNVDVARIPDNIFYRQQDLWEFYNELFDEALIKYNEKQTRSDRKILDYYEHIKNGRQEKPFTEIIVQFGDDETCGLASENWNAAKEMLDEYMREFEARNPNLKVFNACMHLDESCPHLHIDFVPVCHNQTRGLETRVSMKQALEEQGFFGGSSRVTEWASWSDAERKYMTEILQRHGFTRDIKGNHLPHIPIEEYRKAAAAKQEIGAINAHINTLLGFDSNDLSENDVALIKNQNTLMRSKIKKQAELISAMSQKLGARFVPVQIFDEDKMQYIIVGLEKAKIPFVEESTTLYIPEYAQKTLTVIANRYSPDNKLGFRAQTAFDIDLLIYNSDSLDELLAKLKERGYEIKRGKHLAVKPVGAERFIRLKSLGAGYTENNLAKRIAAKEFVPSKFKEWQKNADPVKMRFCVTASEYITAVRTFRLTPKKAAKSIHYEFQNDAEIQRIVNQLRTIDEFGFTSREQIYAKADELQAASGDEAKEKLGRVHELIKVYEEIIEGNYIDNLIKEEQERNKAQIRMPKKSR